MTRTSSGKYFVSCLFDDSKSPPAPLSKGGIKGGIGEGKAIGIDLGLNHFAITSDGTKHGNPRYYRKYETKLAKKQQELSHKQLGSNNRYKAKVKVAKVSEKINRCREDFLHKLSRKLVDENQVICVENLALRNMIQKRCRDGGSIFPRFIYLDLRLDVIPPIPAPVGFPDKRERAPRYHKLAKSINDDRDINAAKNIRDEGLRIMAVGRIASASGERVRPSKGTAFTRHFSTKEESTSSALGG